ncbi:MAG TPA: DUF4258 domain-containing protein [Thermoguttaceae bacterium]|nr:DUF4258 domain-containing protein [Thermoguttaceae bacterium]
MKTILEQIQELVASGRARISEHGYDELMEDHILAGDVVGGVPQAQVVEEYPDYPKGPCVLVLERDSDGQPVHALWGIPRGHRFPAVLVTAYRPDPEKWSDDFMRRKE